MPLPCPVCKADNAAGPACRRCKADLTMLLALDERRTALLAQSRQSAQRGDLGAALDSARQANDLRRDRESLRWLTLMLVQTENFGEAWQAYQSSERHG